MAKGDTSTAVVMSDKAGTGVVVVPREVVDAKMPQDRPLSLVALKVLHVLLDAAAPHILEPVAHVVPLAALRVGHHGSDHIVLAVRELQRTILELETEVNGRPVMMSGQVLTDCGRDFDDRGVLRFKVSDTMRFIIGHSRHWAAVSLRVVLALESRYALRLYQFASLRAPRRQMFEVVPLDDFRALMGVPVSAYTRWADLDRKVVSRATAEVSHVTDLVVEADPIIERRRVVAVKLSWRNKTVVERSAAQAEIEGPRAGRTVRRADAGESALDAQRELRASILADFARLPVARRVDDEDRLPDWA